jgi:uncharacterized protein (TIGR00297 family)
MVVLAAALALHGYYKRSLSLDGAVAAFLLGSIILSQEAYFGTILFVFYASSSLLTRFGSKSKARFDDYKQGGQRDAFQVLCNGLTGLLWCVYHAYYPTSAARLAYLGHFSCCIGDTWSSELGILSLNDPFLITTLASVPKGTNGGVSTLGLLASVMGGTLLGLTAFAFYPVREMIFVGMVAGLGGSLIDSLLGATLQKSVTGNITIGRDILTNNQVNFISSLLSSICVYAIFL